MPEPTTAPQSTFVTVLAWIIIIFASLAVAGSLLQMVMLHAALPIMFKAQASGNQPDPSLSIAIIRGFMIFAFAFACFVLFAARALLKRKNWARRTFVVLLGLGIAFNVLWALAAGMGIFFAPAPASGAQAFPAEMLNAIAIMNVALIVFALAISIIYGWLTRRLRSAAVKSEFSRGRALRLGTQAHNG